MQLYLGVLIFSFIVTALLIVPFIDFLYRMKLVRKLKRKKSERWLPRARFYPQPSMISRLGHPTGLGILLILVIAVLFIILFPTLLLPKIGASLVSNFPMYQRIGSYFCDFCGFCLTWDV